MASKPTILLIPGSFCPASLYNPLIDLLKSHSYSARTIDLLSVGPPSVAGTTMADDAAHIASIISPLAAEGKEILLVAHSYGGAPTTEAVKGFATSKGDGKGGVVGIVYLTCVVPEVGKTVGETLANAGGLKPWIAVNEAGTHMAVSDVEAAAADAYNDVSLEEAIPFVKQWPGHSAMSFGGELTYGAYKDVPVTYLVCEDDNIIPPSAQMSMVENMKKSGAQVEVVSKKCGHCPNASQPEMVIELIRRAAGEVV